MNGPFPVAIAPERPMQVLDSFLWGGPLGGVKRDVFTAGASDFAAEWIDADGNRRLGGFIRFTGTAPGGVSAKLYDFTITGADKASIDTAVDGTTVANFAGFTTLMIWFLARTDQAVVRSEADITFNNDGGANYDTEQFRALGAGVVGAGAVALTSMQVEVPGASANASYASVGRATIPAYADTTFFKTMEILTGYNQNTAAANFGSLYIFSWRNTAAVTRIKLAAIAGSKLKVGSRLIIYGT